MTPDNKKIIKLHKNGQKLVKNYKIEDPGVPRKIIEKLYPKRASKLENYQKIMPEA